MSPTYPSNSRGTGGGIGYLDPVTKFMKQPFRPAGPGGRGEGPLPGYLAKTPMPGKQASPSFGFDAPPPGYGYSPKPGVGQYNMGFYGKPGQVPTVPYSPSRFARLPYGLMARILTGNPYIIAGATLMDVLTALEPLPVTSLTQGHYDMTGWTLECSSPSGQPWTKVAGIGPFAPPPSGCPEPLLVPVESYGADLGPAGAGGWAWIAFGPASFFGIRMDGEEKWRRTGPFVDYPPWVRGFPFWERSPVAYNPYNPDTWLPGQPIQLLPKIPYKAIPGRKYPVQGDGRNAPRKDYGNNPSTGGAPAPQWHSPSKPTKPSGRTGIKRRTLPSLNAGGGPGNPVGNAPHVMSPPGIRVKERKHTPKNYAAWKKLADRIGGVLEFADIVGAIYKALPWQIRSWKGRDGKWRDKDPTLQGKLMRILNNLNQLDLAQVVVNVAANQLEDKFFGLLGTAGKKATQSLVGGGYWQGLGGLGLGSPTGPVNPLPGT